MNWTDQGFDREAPDTEKPARRVSLNAWRMSQQRDEGMYEGRCVDAAHFVRVSHDFDRDGRCYFCPARTDA